MQIDSSHTFHGHTVSFRFVVFLSSDNNVLPEGNLPYHFALNVYQTIVLAYIRCGAFLDQSADLQVLCCLRALLFNFGDPRTTKAQPCKALFFIAALGVDAFGDQMFSQFPSVTGQHIVP
jgi:hypothetical protein